MQAPRPGERVVQDNALNRKIDFDLNVSTIATECFQMKLVCSVNAMKKFGK
jgi:hypothetical protein